MGRGPLLAEDERLVLPRPAVQEIGVAVRGESVQLVVPASAEGAIRAPASEDGVGAVVPVDDVSSLVPRDSVTAVASEHRVRVGASV